MEVEDLAYAAGFLEADGCISVGKHSLTVKVTNKHLPTLQWFLNTFGGTVNQKSTPKDCYDWLIHSHVASAFLEGVRPFLKMKIREADLAMEFHRTLGIKGMKTPVKVKEYREVLKNLIKEARKCR